VDPGSALNDSSITPNTVPSVQPQFSGMIISHNYRFIFIKTVKTAGTSIEVFLSSQGGAQDVVTPIAPPVAGHEPRNFTGFVNPLPEIVDRPAKLFLAIGHMFSKNKFYNHMPALLVQKRVPRDIWQSYFKFCVERNPWDKTLSHYHMHAARTDEPLSFDDYLTRGKLPINYPRYTDASGKQIIVDRVLRYENLNAELSEVFAQLGIPFTGMLGVRAKSDYRQDRTPYQTVFNDRQRQIVEKAFAREIELHGYRF
jgi:hypothetical protein